MNGNGITEKSGGGINSKQEDVDVLLNKLQQKYNDILSKQKPETLERALKILADSRKKVHSNKGKNIQLNIENLDEKTKKIFELMKSYEQEIKQIFISNGKNITHITDVSPENLRGGKIAKSLNRANDCETESGDWVFASSSPVDGNNPYIARISKYGMIRIPLPEEDMYIYGTDNMQIKQDEQGKNNVILKEPNYVYEINPQNFTPVVTLKKDKKGHHYFHFTKEWISEQEVDISDPNQVRKIEEISDITELLENYQVLSDVYSNGEGIKILSSKSKEEGLKLLKERIKAGRLRYINQESGINVNEILLPKEKLMQSGLKIESLSSDIRTMGKRQDVYLEQENSDKMCDYIFEKSQEKDEQNIEIDGENFRRLVNMEYTKELQYKKAYVELYEIIKRLSDEEKNKIPKAFIEELHKERDKNYLFNYDDNKSLLEQNLMIETQALLVSVYKKFIALDSEKEIWKKYDTYCYSKIEEQKKIKYGNRNIFENDKLEKETKKDTEESSKDELAIIVSKKNFFDSFIEMIKNKLIKILKKW